MIRRVNQPKRGGPPADLLVCFPSRAHLTLMPKQISSPGRVGRRQMKRLPSTRLGQSPGVSEASEPSSPKVTCAGQIKVRPRAGGSCKSWQSVMEEIDRIRKTQKKKPGWGDALGIKKDVLQFLTCLRNIKLDFRCFGAVPECELSSDEEEEEEEEEGDGRSQSEGMENEGEKRSRTDWFMVVQEKEDGKEKVTWEKEREEEEEVGPPANALVLMRCRSAPAKSWLENRGKEEEEEREEEGEEERVEKKVEKERKKLRDYLVVMEYDTELYKLSTEVAKETWVVGSVNPFSRSRSCKR